MRIWYYPSIVLAFNILRDVVGFWFWFLWCCWSWISSGSLFLLVHLVFLVILLLLVVLLWLSSGIVCCFGCVVVFILGFLFWISSGIVFFVVVFFFCFGFLAWMILKLGFWPWSEVGPPATDHISTSY